MNTLISTITNAGDTNFDVRNTLFEALNATLISHINRYNAIIQLGIRVKTC